MAKRHTQEFQIDYWVWTILLLGLAVRLIGLGIKPPHPDEGVNGWFVDQLISKGFYAYDAANYHGPLHYYLLFLSKIFFGRNLWALRLPDVLFGIGCIYLTLRFKNYFGKTGCYLAALFMAVSPGMVFYSRYAIHEPEFLFFTILAILGFFRFQTQKDKTSLWQMGLGITGMILTKEVFFIHLAGFGLALIFEKMYGRVSPAKKLTVKTGNKYVDHDLNLVMTVCILILVVFYSGFFMNPRGLGEFLKTFRIWIPRGIQGVGHEKPFYYWGCLFLRYEWFALAGMLLSVRLLRPAPYQLRILGLYAWAVFFAYSLIAYKTPWCVIQMIWPFSMAAGICLADLAQQKQKKHSLLFLASFLILADAAKSINLNFLHYTDEKEPYVYVQTFPDVMKVMDRLNRMARQDPEKKHMRIHLIMENNWPLPWLLGDFTKVYYANGELKNPGDADLILGDITRRAPLEMTLRETYFVERLRFRDAYEDVLAYYNVAAFKDYFAPETERFIPQPQSPLKEGEGLLAQYFNNIGWKKEPVLVRKVNTIDNEWNDIDRPWPPPFGIIFSGEIRIPQKGVTAFYLESDDGSSLEIDHKLLIDNFGAHSAETKSAAGSYSPGWYPITVRYYDIGGGAIVRLWWQLPGGKEEKIPPENFRVKNLNPKHIPER